ncbi:MAG: pitrilysin family protein [Pseudomonadota bacterium]
MQNSTTRLTVLENGLRIVTEQVPDLESAALGIWVGSGARDEMQTEHGIAHLLEHMAFKGTSTRSAEMIAREIEAVGGDLNAMTSHETTGYHARILGQDVPLGIDILSDIVVDSIFDSEELGREQQVIVQEIGAAHDTPDDLVFDLFQEAAFGAQPLGRPILGTPESVTGFSAGDLRKFLERNYGPHEMVVTAAGAIDHDMVVELALSRLGGRTTNGHPQPEPAEFIGGDRRADRPLDQIHIVMGLPGPDRSAEDFHAARVAATALGGGMSSRLFQEVREKRGLCYSVYAFNASYRDSGLFAFSAATAPELAGELIEVLTDEISHAALRLTEEDVDRARAQLRASLLMSLESTSNRADRLARQLLFFDRIVPLAETREKIEAVTLEDVRRVLNRALEGRLAFAAVGPVERLPSVDALAARIGCSAPMQG